MTMDNAIMPYIDRGSGMLEPSTCWGMTGPSWGWMLMSMAVKLATSRGRTFTMGDQDSCGLGIDCDCNCIVETRLPSPYVLCI